jgi:hypothetical protein
LALPIYGRDGRTTMERLLPGSVDAGLAVSYNVPVTSFNGVSGLTNNYRVDGSDVNDYFHGASTSMPAVENMAEFTVSSSLPDASFGRAAGGQITAVLKSGGNQPHGELWGYFQDSDWNANRWENNWRGIPKEEGSRQWYGGNAGGPVFLPKLYDGRNKTFFFTSYERTSTSQTGTSTGRTISDAERAGDFSSSPGGIPVVDGVPAPTLTPAYFSPLGKFVTGNTTVLPRPTSGVDTFSWQAKQDQVVQNFLGKIDHNFNERHRLFGSLWWSRDVPTMDNMFFIFGKANWGSHYPNPNVEWSLPTKLQSWTLNDTYAVSPTMLNNFILGVKRLMISVQNTYDNDNPLFGPADTGIGGVGDVSAPDIQQISTPRSLGMGIYNGYIDDMTQNSVYVADNVSLTVGRHTLKMGFEVRQYHELKYQTWGAGANIGFGDGRQDRGGTGNGYADLLLGKAPNFTQNNTQVLNIYYPAREAYVQDTMKVNSRVTTTIGVRWQPHFGIHSATGNFVTFRPGQASTVFPTAPVGLVAVGDQGVPGNLHGNRWANFGPRASVAWDLLGNGRAAIRAGYALMSDYQVLLGFNGYTNTAPYGVQYNPKMESLNLATPYAEYQQTSGTAPFPFTAPKAGDPGNSKIKFPVPVNTLGKSPDYNSAAIHQWNATFDFEPIKTYLFSIGYVGTRGTHLSNDRDFNFPWFVPGASTNATDNVRTRRPYYAAGFQTVTMSFSDFNSLYSSLQARFNKRYSYGLTFMGHYTISSNRTQHGFRDPANRSLDYYSPGLDQRFALAYSWDVPIPKGKSRLSKAILGGWTLGGAARGSSGGYGSIGDYSCSQFNFSSASCVANFLGGSPYVSNQGQPKLDSKGSQLGVYWLDAAKFIRPNQLLVDGTVVTHPDVGKRLFLGNATQGVYKGPASFMLDATLQKAFALTESSSIDFRIDAMNVLNHTVLNGPGGTVGPDMTTFGLITSAWDPRKIQMSVKFVF